MFSKIFFIVTALACMLVFVHAQQLNGNIQRRELQSAVRRSRASVFELQDEAEVCDTLQFVETHNTINVCNCHEHVLNILSLKSL